MRLFWSVSNCKWIWRRRVWGTVNSSVILTHFLAFQIMKYKCNLPLSFSYPYTKSEIVLNISYVSACNFSLSCISTVYMSFMCHCLMPLKGVLRITFICKKCFRILKRSYFCRCYCVFVVQSVHKIRSKCLMGRSWKYFCQSAYFIFEIM